MATKAEPIVETRLAELHAALSRERPRKATHTPNAEAVGAALDKGAAVVAVKAFKADGAKYSVGDPFDYARMPRQAVIRLAEHGFIAPAADVDRGAIYARKAKYYQQSVLPAESYWQLVKRESQAAEAGLAAARTALKAAEVAYSDSRARLAGAERDLGAALDGPELDEVLGE